MRGRTARTAFTFEPASSDAIPQQTGRDGGLQATVERLKPCDDETSSYSDPVGLGALLKFVAFAFIFGGVGRLLSGYPRQAVFAVALAILMFALSGIISRPSKKK
jgi:hypothetical protein